MNCGENASDYLSRWVRLNVGGTIFLTTRTTLARYPDSFLHRLCKEDSDLKTDKDESGVYLIERNPNYFAPILDFLRHGELIMDQQVAEEGVLREAEFFVLPDLARLVQLKIQDKLKARMVELKLVEEWRMEEKLKLEQKLGIIGKKPRRTVQAFLRGMADVNFEISSHIQQGFNRGWKLDQIKYLDNGDGILVFMSEE